MKNVLVSALGTATSLAVIKQLRRARDEKFKIIGTDINPRDRIAGPSFCDKFYTVPRYDESGFLETLLSICRIERVEFLLPVLDYEIEVFARNRQKFEAEGVIICSSGAKVVESCNDKLATKEIMSQYGMPCPDVYLLSQADVNALEYPCFIKPRRGVASKNCRIIKNSDQLRGFMYSCGEEMIVQTLLTGDQYVIDVVNDLNGKTVVSIPRREYVSKSGVGTNVTVLKDLDLQEYGRRVSEAMGLCGAVNIEVFKNGDTIDLIEINPRFSAGSVFSCIAGVNLAELVIEIFSGCDVSQRKFDWRENLSINRYWEEIEANGF